MVFSKEVDEERRPAGMATLYEMRFSSSKCGNWRISLNAAVLAQRDHFDCRRLTHRSP